MTTVLHRTLVVLKLPLSVPALIKTGEAIVTAMTNNVAFTTPNPPLAGVSALVTKLDVAETATKTRAVGTKQARDAARVAVRRCTA